MKFPSSQKALLPYQNQSRQVHPDVIEDYSAWEYLGSALCIENMDQRKAIGRTADELGSIFDRLPSAALCFDIGHARQVDTTMTAYFIIQQFRAKQTPKNYFTIGEIV